jgi:hypothetical protein
VRLIAISRQNTAPTPTGSLITGSLPNTATMLHMMQNSM